MGIQLQPFKILTPQLSLTAAGTPERISAINLLVRSVIIEVADDAKGKIFIADTEVNAGTTNRHVLLGPGSIFTIAVDPYGNLNAMMNLRDLWFNGTRTDDKIVVSYIEITEAIGHVF